MPRYLIIHASIRFIIKVVTFLVLCWLLSNIYALIFHRQIIEVMSIVVGDYESYFSWINIGVSFLFLGSFLYMIWSLLERKWWAVIVFLGLVIVPLLDRLPRHALIHDLDHNQIWTWARRYDHLRNRDHPKCTRIIYYSTSYYRIPATVSEY